MFFYAIAAVVLSACAKESDVNVSGNVETVTFKAVASVESKTVLQDQTKVYWCAGDQISVMGAAAAFTNDLSADETAAAVDFTGDVATAETYYAVYPYSAVSEWTGTVAAMTLPDAQTAIAGTFASGLNITAAKTTSQDKSFVFNNLVGYLKFTIGTESGSIKQVFVTANGGESVAGKFTVDVSENVPAVTPATGNDARFHVSLSSSDSNALPAGDYYIAMLPGTYTKGLTLDFVNTDGAVASKSVETSMTLEAGNINSIGTVSGLEWTESSANTIWRGKFVSKFYQGLQALSWGGYNWSQVKAGDVLKITAGPGYKNAGWWCLCLRSAASWATLAGAEEQYNNARTLNITLTEEMITDLKTNNGLVLTGQNVSITCVELIPASGEDNPAIVIWEEEPVNLGTDWTNNVQINHNTFPKGSVLYVEYETPAEVGAGYYQLKFNYIDSAWQWHKMNSAEAEENDYGCVTLSTSQKVYSVALSDSDIDNIKEGKGIAIQGYAATITKVYYKAE